MGITKEQLTSIARKTEDVPVPPLNDTIKVGQLMFGGRGRYRDAVVGINGDGKLAVRDEMNFADVVLLQECILNPDGTPMFSREETHLVAAIPSEVADILLPVIRRISGLTKEAEAEAGKEPETQTNFTPIS